MHVHAQTFQNFFFYFRSMQVDITGVSEAGDVKFIGDSSFKIIDGSVVATVFQAHQVKKVKMRWHLLPMGE